MPDGPKIDLFPAETLSKIATPTEPLVVPPAAAPDADAKCRDLFGPLYAAVTVPPGAPGGLADALAAEGALAVLPAALLGPLARPLVEGAYSIVDKIPEAIRRPFEKDLGLLIDNALSFLSDAAYPLVGATLDKFGATLPPSVKLDVQAFAQMYNSCGETASATILKAEGVPIAVGDVDTQIDGYPGTSGQQAMELRRRGLTVVSGPGDRDRLRTLVAAGMPVMVQVGWPSGGGHFAVVSGYDDVAQTFTIRNWDGKGGTIDVGYREFETDWARAAHLMTAALPRRDPRFDGLEQAADWRRPTPIYQGLTLSDLWVTERGEVYVEGAYRYASDDTDVTVRVGFDSSEVGLARRLNGSVAVRRRLGDGWFVGLQITKLSVKGVDDDWHHFDTAPLAAYATVEGPHGFSVSAGGERGGFQAALAAQLFGSLGLSANASVDADGTWRVTATLAGTW